MQLAISLSVNTLVVAVAHSDEVAGQVVLRMSRFFSATRSTT